jgi:hypothetical protein
MWHAFILDKINNVSANQRPAGRIALTSNNIFMVPFLFRERGGKRTKTLPEKSGFLLLWRGMIFNAAVNNI